MRDADFGIPHSILRNPHWDILSLDPVRTPGCVVRVWRGFLVTAFLHAVLKIPALLAAVVAQFLFRLAYFIAMTGTTTHCFGSSLS
jgi:hypothetical protein